MAISKSGLPNLDNPGTKYKDKVPNVSDSNQNIETSCKSQTQVIRTQRFVHQKFRKTSQRWIYVKQHFPKPLIFNFLIPLPNVFTVDTEEY